MTGRPPEPGQPEQPQGLSEQELARVEPLLARAAQAARDQDPPDDWPAVARSVRERVARATVPASRIQVREPGRSSAPGAPDGSRTFVSSRVLVDALRRMLQREATHAPARVDVDVDDGRLRGVHLEVVVAYGVEIEALAEQLRVEVDALVAELVGSGNRAAVDVDVVDVVDGDPRYV